VAVKVVDEDKSVGFLKGAGDFGRLLQMPK
jgi:hypothetical protein